MKEKSDCTKRLRKAVNGIKYRYHFSTQKDILKDIGYNAKSYLSDLLAGKIELSERFISALSEKYLINPTYIYTGNGNIWLDNFENDNVALIGDGIHDDRKNTITPTNPDLLRNAIMEELREIRGLFEEELERTKEKDRLYIESNNRFISLLEKVHDETAEQMKLTEKCQEQMQELISIVKQLTCTTK